MSSWSQRRKTTYALSVIFLLVALVGIPAFYYLYTPPTCSDGIKNGSEQDIDCGGSCERLCASSFLTPIVSWSRLQNVAPGLYNVATYIINPNPNAEAQNVPYHVIVYDKQGVEITQYSGTVTLPAHRNTLVYRGALSTDQRIPARVLFEFSAIPDWRVKNDPLAAITIGNKNFSEYANSSSLAVTINNTSIRQIGKTDVYAVLYDKDNNALGFSKTIIDRIPSNSSVVAPFTWPTSFDNKVISIEVLPVAE